MIKVLTHFAHESYQRELAAVPGVEYYHLTAKCVAELNVAPWQAHERPKIGWPADVDIPDNVHLINSVEELKSLEFDLALIHWHPLLEPFKRTFPVLPKIFLEHTWPYQNLSSEINRWKIIRRDCVDWTVFITPASQEAWGEKESNKASYIYHSFDLDVFPERLISSKRPNTIITTTNEFISRDWACGFTLWCNVLGVPTSPYFKEIYLFGYGNDNLGKPWVQGKRTREEVCKVLAEGAAVYFNPSIMSPIPMSLLEAVAIGVPIVTTAHCEPGRIFEHEIHGIVSNDPAVLRKGIRDILDNFTWGMELAQNARKVIQEKFAPEHFRKSWRTIFENVAMRKG